MDFNDLFYEVRTPNNADTERITLNDICQLLQMPLADFQLVWPAGHVALNLIDTPIKDLITSQFNIVPDEPDALFPIPNVFPPPVHEAVAPPVVAAGV